MNLHQPPPAWTNAGAEPDGDHVMDELPDKAATDPCDPPPDEVPTMAQLPADLLAYATKFTFDGNRVEPGDRRWHPDLMISVERARPGEWRIVQTGMAYDHRNDTWEIEYAARVAQGADRSAFHTGRDDAVSRALTLIERIRKDLAAT